MDAWDKLLEAMRLRKADVPEPVPTVVIDSDLAPRLDDRLVRDPMRVFSEQQKLLEELTRMSSAFKQEYPFTSEVSYADMEASRSRLIAEAEAEATRRAVHRAMSRSKPVVSATGRTIAHLPKMQNIPYVANTVHIETDAFKVPEPTGNVIEDAFALYEEVPWWGLPKPRPAPGSAGVAGPWALLAPAVTGLLTDIWVRLEWSYAVSVPLVEQPRVAEICTANYGGDFEGAIYKWASGADRYATVTMAKAAIDKRLHEAGVQLL